MVPRTHLDKLERPGLLSDDLDAAPDGMSECLATLARFSSFRKKYLLPASNPPCSRHWRPGGSLRGAQGGKKAKKIVSIEEIFEASVAKMQRLSQCDGQMLPDFPKVRLHFCDHCIAESHHFCLEM